MCALRIFGHIGNAASNCCNPEFIFPGLALMKRLLLLVLLPCLSVLLAGCGYNDIQRLDEQVKTAWSQTLNQYERRAELVPKLVNSVNAYMVNERAVLTQVTEARSKVGSVQISAKDIDNQELMARFEQAEGQLSSD